MPLRVLIIEDTSEHHKILTSFDPRRAAILLLGGNKVGNNRWYEENVPSSDKLYDELLKELETEGLI